MLKKIRLGIIRIMIEGKFFIKLNQFIENLSESILKKCYYQIKTLKYIKKNSYFYTRTI